MPANLNNPFGESCCDGGECNTSHESAQPCGCDKGANHLCDTHKTTTKYKVMLDALLDILTADETSTVDGAVAIAQHAIDEITRINKL